MPFVFGVAGGRPLSLPISTKRSYDFGHQISLETQQDIEPDVDASGPESCPFSSGLLVMSMSTGAIYPTRCKRNVCAYCVQLNARRRSLAISLSKPSRAILLTQVGNDFQTIRARMNRLKYMLEQEIPSPIEWVYSTEPNPAGTGNHVHAWERGKSMIPQALLSSSAVVAGMGGFARINKIRSNVGASKYGLKGLGYGLKGAMQSDAARSYMKENNGRLTHQSRGFFTDVAGESVPVRISEREAGRLTAKDLGPWKVFTP